MVLSGLLIALTTAVCPFQARSASMQTPKFTSLADALESFAKSHAYQLVYRAELVQGLQSPGISPGLPPAEALQQLLQGTDLRFKFINENTIVLFRADDDPGAVANLTPHSTIDHHEPPSGRPTVSQRDTGLQEIQVTARKRSEAIQDVPVAVTVIDAEAINRSRAATIADLNEVAPSLSLQNFAIIPFNLTAVIRGIGTADFEPSTDPAVAIIIDGVPQAASNGAPTALFDTQSVEVLRGPQGTLFGRNATAGAILIENKRPENVLGIEAQATAGNYGQLDFSAAVTGPILQDKLSFRLSVADRNLEGYYRNYDGRRLGKIDRYAVRPSLLYTPSDNLTVYLTAEYTDDHSQTTPAITGLPSLGGHWGASVSEFNTTVNESENYGSIAKSITLNADYRSSNGRWTVTANDRKFAYSGNFDVDGTPATVLAVDRVEEHEQESGELRFSSRFDGRFSFTAGGLVLKHRYDLNYNGLSATLIPRLDPTGPGVPVLVIDNSQSSQSVSLYGLGTLRFDERWSLDFGANYDYEKKIFDFDRAVVFSFPATPGVFEKSWGNLGPKLGLNFKASNETLLYASYSRGFRSGGFSGRAFDPRNLGPYLPEHVDSYEVGLKHDMAGERLRLNLSTYYNRYQDLQRPFPNAVGYNGTTPNPLELITFNAAGANIEGFEAEFTASPAAGVTLATSFDYLHARYEGFKDPATGESLNQLKLVYAPSFTARQSAIYREDLTPEWFAELSADYAYSSSLETDTLNAPVGHRERTNIFNAALTLGQEAGPLNLTIWVKNLTNDIYVVSAQTGMPYFSIFTIDAPRTFGITASVKF